MKKYFYNATKTKLLAADGQMAENFFTRARGLLGRSHLNSGEGLCLLPCNAIHMFFMRFALDAVFVDGDGIVVGLEENLKPFALSKVYAKAKCCLELPTGTINMTGTAIGDKILFGDAPFTPS